MTMKKLILSFLTLLLTMTVSADTDTTISLSVDSMVLFGNQLAQLTQQVDIGVHNDTAEDFEGRLWLMAFNQDDGNLTPCLDTLITIKARTARQLLLYTALPEGRLQLRLTTDADGQKCASTCEVTIQPLRKLDMKASFSLDMLSDQAVLYGSRIKGMARVVNRDALYYGVRGGKGEDDGIVLWLEDRNSGERLFTKHAANMLQPYGSVETDFAYDAVFRDGARYALKAGYGMPYGLEAIDSLCFTIRTGTCTYWTASGEVLPLPVSEDHTQLVVPAEAVAVDLRGWQTSVEGDGASPTAIDASQANPNCLYYLDLTGNLPEGLDENRNIIRGLEAENIKVTEGYDYYCPLAFHTQFISFLMTPSYDNPDDELRGRGYSETLVLPFYPRYVNLYDVNGGNVMLHADMLKVLRYYDNVGDTLNIVQLTSISQMHAYEPYILGVYIGSQLLFIGENTKVPVTQEAIVRGKDVNFVGTTVGRQLPDITYQYSTDDTHFYPSTARIEPFRAYMDIEKDTTSIDSLFFSVKVWGAEGKPGDATAIDDIPIYNLPSYNLPFDSDIVCDLSGRQIGNRKAVNRRLPKGIYITGGRMVVVK